jgi:hypothetical protein
MMRRLARILSLAAFSLLLVLIVACDGDGEESGTTADATDTPATATVAPAAQATEPAAAPEPPLSQEEARDKLSRAAVLIDDLPSGFVIQGDDYADNVAASASYPDPAGTQTFLDGTGRVLGRTVVYTAEDIVQTALAGEAVGFFSSVNAFQETAGAGQYYAVTVEMIGQGPAAVAQFADLFVDPNAVQVTAVPAATIGDESQAFALTGQTESQGQQYPLIVLLVTLHRGRTAAFLGSVQVGIPPDVHKVETLGGLLVDRIDEEF